MYRFANPWYFLLLLALPALAYWIWMRGSRNGTMRYSALGLVEPQKPSLRVRLRHVVPALRLLGIALVIIAFARPQTGITGEEVLTDGIDIMMVVDVSGSMLAEDLQPNRIEAAKAVAAEFVRGRPNDRIGLVVFAGEAFTQAPLTLDHAVVETLMGELSTDMIEAQGTAIGMGLATAIKRLENSEAESKIIVLVTDGRNNRGQIDPLTAAQMAQALGIKVYTIGAGSRGMARIPVNDPLFGRRYQNVQVDIDEETLTQTAEMTGGRYFRATDRDSLGAVYDEIDRLEKTEIEVLNFTRYGELFQYPLSAGVALILLELALGNTVLRRVP